jgi:hypothetical protein
LRAPLFHDVFVISERDTVTPSQIKGIASRSKQGASESRDTSFRPNFKMEKPNARGGNSELLDRSVSIRPKIYS